MKKLLFFACMILLLGGCGPKAQDQQQTQKQENKSVFSSIRDAFNKSLTLRCEYTDENGQKSVNYIKNKMIRTETDEITGEQIIGLFRDDKLYMWGPNSDKGMVFNMEDLQGSDDTKMGDTTIHGTDDIINELENEKDKCKQENVADSFFEVPSNVTFSNLSDMMKQFGQ